MPRKQFGAPLPVADSDVEELLSGAEVETTSGPPETSQGQNAFSDFHGGPVYDADSTQRGHNRVTRSRLSMRTLYDEHGRARMVPVTDVLALIDRDLPETGTAAGGRLYVRCPRCLSLPNHGVHAVDSPNGCPAITRLKYMP